MISRIINLYLSKHNNFSKKTLKKEIKYFCKLVDKFVYQDRNFVDRSFYQYKAQKFQNGILYFIFSNIFGLVSLPFLILIISKKKNSLKLKNSYDAVFWNPLGREIIPKTLKRKYTIKYIEKGNYKAINKQDRSFVLKVVKKHPFSFFFIYKTIKDISYYRGLMNQYNLKVIISTCEYSFTSSILTEFCELNNILHINIMHGEKLFNIRDSFTCFHEFYVWEKYYKNLFINLKCKSCFFIECPYINNEKKIEKNYDYKFYLGMESSNTLILLKEIIEKLLKTDAKIKVRPHPRYTNMKLLKCYIRNDLLELPEIININDSIDETCYVVGRYSTVLQQSFFQNVNIIIDDITQKEVYDALAEYGYIIFFKKHKLLSDFVNL
ncbi:hypothetical protein [Eubacterium callanderi]|uniref:hypothetical protein n=1 Tax=Eubacterium callanderi TaxID=53442 RepID=UPI00399A064D